MKYIAAPVDEVVEKSGSEKIRRIHERVCTIKRSEKIGVKLMQKWEEICLERKAAREEGYKLAQLENAKKMLYDNVAVEVIMRYTELSEKDVLELKRQICD